MLCQLVRGGSSPRTEVSSPVRAPGWPGGQAGSSIVAMVVWVLIGLALIKLPVAALMLWLPYRTDERLADAEDSDQGSDDSGGGEDPPGRPPKPRPRRGPHGLSPRPPARVRRPGHERVPAVERSGCASGSRTGTLR